MDDILVDKDYVITKAPTFSRLAFACSVVALVTFSIIVSKSFSRHPTPVKVDNFSVINTLILLTSLILGVIFSILSFVKKERLKFFKLTGAIMNFLIFLLVTISILFALFKDAKNS